MTALALRPTTRFGGLRPHFARTPAEQRLGSRDGVRLLVARPESITHTRFGSIIESLRPGDALVVNTSATVNGEIDATWVASGARRPVVLHAATQLAATEWVVELRTAPDASRAVLDAARGHLVEVGSGALAVRLRLTAPWPGTGSPTGTGNRLWRAEAEGDLRALLDADGRPISYGYLADRYPLSAYQTIFGRVPGSAEMASAGRPFTDDIALSLIARGVLFAPVLLHTGVSSQEAGEPPQPEWFQVSGATADLLNHVRERAGRIVAVGTTATRAVESAIEACDGGVRVVASSGFTERVVTPEAPPRVVNGLLTGWHDADASHLLLVEAVAGACLAQRAYDAALAEGYEWHEFGDSCLLLP